MRGLSSKRNVSPKNALSDWSAKLLKPRTALFKPRSIVKPSLSDKIRLPRTPQNGDATRQSKRNGGGLRRKRQKLKPSG
jgi:hypothetical protein